MVMLLRMLMGVYEYIAEWFWSYVVWHGRWESRISGNVKYISERRLLKRAYYIHLALDRLNFSYLKKVSLTRVRHTTNGKPFGQRCPKCAVRSQGTDCLGSEGGKLTKPDQISTSRHRSWSSGLGGWKKSQAGIEETEREASRETCVNSYTLERVRTSKGKEKVFWLNMTTHAEAL